MSRLPDLERSLFDAARRLEAEADGAGGTAPRRGRWRRRGTPLLATAALVVAGGAVAAAAVSGLLQSGDPVPADANSGYALMGKLKPGSSVVLPLRVADPDGGPDWGIGVVDIQTRSTRLGHVAVRAGTMRCVRIGRVQNGVLGVLGRDGVFGDDGRFHPLMDRSSQSGMCGTLSKDGQLMINGYGPPIPASGYTGINRPPIGGCIEHRLTRWNSSPQTRRRLRGIPVCDPAGKRIVRYGFAGRLATRATLANDEVRLTTTPGESGAYLFVLKPSVAGKQPLRLTVTYRDGTVCRDPTISRHPGRKPPLDPDCFPPPGF
jgi:hypothetical protein